MVTCKADSKCTTVIRWVILHNTMHEIWMKEFRRKHTKMCPNNIGEHWHITGQYPFCTAFCKA